MPPPASCTTAVLARINDQVLFASWKDATNTSIGMIVAGTPEATVSALETDIANTIECLMYQTQQKRGLSTDIAGLQDRFVQTQKDLEDKIITSQNILRSLFQESSKLQDDIIDKTKSPN